MEATHAWHVHLFETRTQTVHLDRLLAPKSRMFCVAARRSKCPPIRRATTNSSSSVHGSCGSFSVSRWSNLRAQNVARNKLPSGWLRRLISGVWQRHHLGKGQTRVLTSKQSADRWRRHVGRDARHLPAVVFESVGAAVPKDEGK